MPQRRFKTLHKTQRGATLMEFSIAATVFFMVLFGVLEVSRLLWIHNALTEVARSGARAAVINQADATRLKNIIVYGTASPAPGADPVVPGLTMDMVAVTYSSDFGVNLGTATVTISGYTFNFSVPLLGSSVSLPTYKSAMTGESAGIVPGATTTPTPTPTPSS